MSRSLALQCLFLTLGCGLATFLLLENEKLRVQAGEATSEEPARRLEIQSVPPDPARAEELLKQQLALTKAEIQRLTAELEEAKARVHPKYERTRKQAEEEARAEFFRDDPRYDRVMAELRREPSDLEIRQVQAEMLRDYGRALTALGIRGSRREEILDVLVEARLRENKRRLQVAVGMIDAGELRSGEVADLFRQALDTAEYEEFKKLRRRESEDRRIQSYELGLMETAPALSQQQRTEVAQAVVDLIAATDQYAGEPDGARQDLVKRVRAAREGFRGRFSEEEMAGLDRFLESRGLLTP